LNVEHVLNTTFVDIDLIREERKMTEHTRKFAVAALAASSMGIALPGVAQDSDADAASGERRYEAVVVTAQRREQSLIDVPLSVSAFDAQLLSDLGVTDLTEVSKVTPNVTLEVSRGTNTTLTAFIRGVGQQDPVAGFEAGVGVYIDDVYLNRPQAAVLDVFDVERIEVLRGPQGTLYGRNTIGGAVKYVTQGLADEPEFDVRARVGTFDQTDVILNGSVPVTDTFRVGGALAVLQRDGFGENLNQDGLENYNKDVKAGRVSAEWDVLPDLQFRVSADYLVDQSEARQGHRLIPGQLSGAPVLDDVFDTRAGLDVIDQDVEAYGGSFVAEWALNDRITLKNILAYREDESTTPIDFDSLPAADLDVPAIYENDQFSEELQLLYSGERLNGVVGFYYLDANASTVFDVLLETTGDVLGLPGLNAQTFGDVGTETWSIFGDFTFDVTDRLSLTLGGRYTEDERTSTVLRRTFINGFSEFFGGDPALIATTSDFDGTADFDDFSPRASLSYALTPDSNVYVTYSQGFKGGSFDPRGQTTAAPDFNGDGTVSDDEIFDFMQFDPEEVDNVEIGYKASQFGGRLNYSIAGFYNDYSDIQVPGSVGVDTDGDGVNETFTGVTTNAGAATIKGVEFEGNAVVAEDALVAGDRFNTSWTVGYIDAEYDEFIDAFGNDVADERVFQNTPKWTASGRFAYETPFKLVSYDGMASASTLISYRSETSQFEEPNAFLDQDAYTLVDAKLEWETADKRWAFNLTGKNLTDKEYIVSGYNFVDVGPGPTFTPTLGREGTLTAFFGNPRTFTLGVDFHY
jgi:iron complex outermembrane recepter protein